MFAYLKKNKLKYMVIVFVCLIGCILRRPDFQTVVWEASDTNYQVLMNIKAMNESNDYFVRITFNEPEDYGVKYSSGAFDRKDGNIFYYVSFQRLPFILIALIFRICHLQPTIQNLYYITSILFCLATFCTAFMFDILFSSKLKNIDVGMWAAIFFMSSTEIMHSQGLNYWGHSIYMIIFPILVVFINNLNDDKKEKWARISIVVLSFCLLQTEWSGYFAVLGLSIYLMFAYRKKNKKNVFLALALLVECGVCFIGFLGINSYLVGFNSLINTLVQRVNGRTRIGDYGIDVWLQSLWKSFAPLIILLIIFSIWSYMKNKNITSYYKKNIGYIWIFVFPLIENFVFANHAVTYSMDRMKWIYILILLLLVAINELMNNSQCKTLVNYICDFTLVCNFILYVWGENSYIYKDSRLENNKYIMQSIEKIKDEAIFVQLGDNGVWGYSKMMIGHAIEPQSTMEQAIEKASKFDKRYAIGLIDVELGYAQKYYSTVIVYDLLEKVYTVSGTISGEFEDSFDGITYLEYANSVLLQDDEMSEEINFDNNMTVEEKRESIERWSCVNNPQTSQLYYKAQTTTIPKCLQALDMSADRFNKGISIENNCVAILNTAGNQKMIKDAKMLKTKNATFDIIEWYADGDIIYVIVAGQNGEKIDCLKYPSTIEIN